MSATRMPALPRAAPLGPLPETVPVPQTTLEALQDAKAQNHEIQKLLVRAIVLMELQRETPELRTIVINPGNNGNYTAVDQVGWTAKSIGILNPGGAPVFVGIGGVSARPTSGAPSCPGGSAMVLPLSVSDVELGCDPAVLGNATKTVYLFRYLTVQPLMLGN